MANTDRPSLREATFVFSTPSIAEQIDSLTRDEADLVAVKILRALAKDAVLAGAQRRRNIVTATREASQLTHLANRLEAFANAE